MAPLRQARPSRHPGREQLRHAHAPLKQSTPAGGAHQPKPATPPPQPVGSQYDYSADPVLQRVQAWVQQQNANAEATALSLRNQALINFDGKNNPFSVMQNLAKQHKQNQSNLNESYNKANLFYSGHRGQALNDEQTNYLHSQYSANQALQGQLQGINANLLASEQNNQSQLVGAQQDAYQRAVDYALKYGAPASPRTATPRTAARRTAIPSSRPSRSALYSHFAP